jgi:hypothetical protein
MRLVLAVAGLAVLVGWGIWSDASADRSPGHHTSADQVSVDGGATARYDGRGKWIGYTPR